MKKLLLLLTVLLSLGVSGAWAETYTFTVTYAKGSSYGQYYTTSGAVDGGHNWDNKWVSGGDECTQLPGVTISSNVASISGYNGYFLNGNYTITVPEGLIITGYTMQAKSYEEGATGTEKSIVPTGQSAVTLNTSSDSEVAVMGLSSNTATFAITGTEGTVSRVIFSSFTIYVQATVLSSLSDADSEKAYYLVSRRGFLATTSGQLGCTVKSAEYVPSPLRIVKEDESYYLKNFSGKYVASSGAFADAASGVLAADNSGVDGFPFVLKVGSNYLNSGTGGTYGIVWNTWGANSTEYDAGNCYAIMEAPADEVLNYSILDVNGATYVGNFRGVYGITIPDFTGCDGYTLTNQSWDSSSRTFSATINFPFPISSNNVTNWTYIGNFNSPDFYLFVQNAEATKVYANADSHDITNTNYQHYQWAIEPSFSSTIITFKIKNCLTESYITSTSTTKEHSNTVSLSSEGTGLTYILNDNFYSWCLPTTTTAGEKLELSIFSSIANKGNQELGTWTVHYGTAIKIANADDFATLVTNLMSLLQANRNKYTFGDGLNQYSLSNATNSAFNSALTDTREEFTAAQLNANIEALSATPVINQPSSGAFYRIKGYSGNYITSNKANSNASMNGTASANNIIYYSEDNNLIFFGSGYGLYNTHSVAPIGSTLNTYTFSQGAQVGKYCVQSNASGVGTYCFDNTSSGSKLDRYSTPVTSGSYQTDWTLEAVTSLPVTFAGEYASFYSPVDLTIPEGVTVYTGTLNGEWLTLNEVTGTLPANTGVILRRQSEETTTVDFPILSTTTSARSDLTGTIAAQPAVEDGVLVLGKNENVWGIYKYTGQLGGFKAYMNKPEGSNVKGFRFNFDTATGIDATEVADYLNAAVYNLAGQRVKNANRGLYIVNGKKVIIK